MFPQSKPTINNLRQEQPVQPPQQSPVRITSSQQIKQVRFKKEVDLIRQQYRFHLEEHPSGAKDIHFTLNFKYIQELPFCIHLPAEYPFAEPQFTFDPPEGFLSKLNTKQKRPISDLMGPWTPSLRLSEIASKAVERLEKSLVAQQTIRRHLIYELMEHPHSLYIIIGFSLMIRLLVGLGGHSGEHDHPQYGDFEAHRNWMSLTFNRPITTWYLEDQRNPKNIWWRLDYPPFAAYHAYFCSLFMYIFVPGALAVQRGYESDQLKLFMRMTSLVTDIVFFYVPVILLHRTFRTNQNISKILLLVLLMSPGFVLIDHGHMQYNSIMLGLVLYAYVCYSRGMDYLCCFLFTLALWTKQMSFYYALGFFSVLLGRALFSSRLLTTSNYRFYISKYTLTQFAVSILRYAWIVAITTLVLWLPWISFSNPSLITQPVSAIFPVHRGLYQLKVSNFWCITDLVFKWEKKYSQHTLVLVTMILTLLSSLPSVIAGVLGFKKERIRNLVFLNISLAFYFFSYHVHQKTILVPMLFVALSYQSLGVMCSDFMVLASFSMFHLLREDKQTLQYFVVTLFYFYLSTMANKVFEDLGYFKIQDYSQAALTNGNAKNNNLSIVDLLSRTFSGMYKAYRLARPIIYIAMLVLHVCQAVINPPKHLPYLFNLLFAFLSFLMFGYFWIASNVRMLRDVLVKIEKNKSKKQ